MALKEGGLRGSLRNISTGVSAIPDTQITRPADDFQGSSSNMLGVVVNPNVDIDGVKAEISTNTTGATQAYLLDSGGVELDSQDISTLNPGDTFSFEASLTTGNDYSVAVDDNGADYTYGRYESPSFPYTGEAFDIPESYNSSGNTTSLFFVLNNIRNLNY